MHKVNRTVVRSVTKVLTAVGKVADVVETGMSALEGMESLLGEQTTVATSSLNSVSDVVQRVLTRDQATLDDFQDRVEQQLVLCRSDLRRAGERAIDSL
eukprot:1503724-Amphidinium_carterae.1